MDAQSTYAGSFPGQPRRPNGAEVSYDSQGLASLITEKLNGFEGFTYYASSSAAIPESTTLPPSQSLPTSVLYERARQAAVAKSSAHARREGLHSTRRPWTPEEEKALMAGLDMVKGPHWSQILQLFGQNGTISDILKDRTQVQLKDKARNLKLFFLKTNSEMPYYLQCVTGELKTRAPSQAARKEAEEQARVQAGSSPVTYASTYMNATSNGTGPLAHGLPIPPRPGSGPSTPVGGNHAHHSPQPSYQQHQGYQQQPLYQQQRPKQLQQSTNGAAPSQPTAAKPLQPQSQHQPIAPAPSYQRPLQQAGTATAGTPQYQQRPVQQPAVQTPASYQQAHQAHRPAAAPVASSAPPRPGPAPTLPQAQTRPPTAAVSQAPPAITRPAPAAPTSISRPPPIPAAVSTPPPPPGTGSAPKSVPTIMPAPPSQSSAPPAPAPARPVQHPPTQPVQPVAQAAVPEQAQATPIQRTAAAAAAPAPTKAPLVSISTPATALSTKSPPAPTPAPAPAPSSNAQVKEAESKEKADDQLLAETLKAVIDSA